MRSITKQCIQLKFNNIPVKYITIIPARGGSKRFPRKNIHLLKDSPLINYSIEYSRNNMNISETYVSTDSMEIKLISKSAGAKLIDRPDDLSGDYITSAAVLRHAVEYLVEQGQEFDYVVLLQATNPLRPKNLLDEAIRVIEEGNYDSLFTVSRSYMKLGKITNGNFLPWNYKLGMRSQDMEPLYYENGLLYITSKKLLLQEVIVGQDAYPFIVDHPFAAVDIDTKEDFEYANFILNLYGRE